MFGPSLRRGVGIGMGLEEQPVDAHRHGRAGQRFDHCPIPAGGGPKTARLLDAVRGVEDYRDPKGLHLGDGPHIADQPTVTEEGPAFAQQDVATARGLELGDDVRHVPGARNCPFFTWTGRPVPPAAVKRSVCRARKAGTCSKSHASATGAACSGRWMSVVIGRPVDFFTSRKTASPATKPGPRYESTLVRLALSNDALKISETLSSSAIWRNRRAMANVAARSSITHGPAMISNG